MPNPAGAGQSLRSTISEDIHKLNQRSRMKSTLAIAALSGLATFVSAAPAEKRTFGRHYNGFDRIKYLFVLYDKVVLKVLILTPYPLPKTTFLSGDQDESFGSRSVEC